MSRSLGTSPRTNARPVIVRIEKKDNADINKIAAKKGTEREPK